VIETVFALPGVGYLGWESIANAAVLIERGGEASSRRALASSSIKLSR